MYARMRLLPFHALSPELALRVALMFQLAGCSLPAIHRQGPGDGGHSERQGDADSDAAQRVDAVGEADPGADAGPVTDPKQDPANRNESLEAFRALVPKQHVFAEWPMPDSAPDSKQKPSLSVSEHVVTDNVTKLRWQRDLPETYPGCTGEYEFVGRKRGAGSGCTWEEAQAYCKRPELAERLGGGTWRVPTKIELESLLDVSRIAPIDPVLDDFPLDCVWSVSPVPNPAGLKLAFALDYMEGTTMDSARFKACRVRCVSSQNAKGGTAPDYQLEREYVRDKTTGLVWQRFPDSATRTWRDAIVYCSALETDGGGWHLPSLKELLTIVDASRSLPPTARTDAFPVMHSERYWTGSEYLDGRDVAYWVDFTLGGTGIKGTINDQHYTLCVR
jgi:hypothetical protein